MNRKAYTWGFAAYCVLMCGLLFGRVRYEAAGDYWQQVAMNLNPVPLETIGGYLMVLDGKYGEELRWEAIVNLVGNVVMFLPLGFFPPMLWERFRPLWRCLLRCGSMIVCVELIQLFTLLGICDVDDLLLNLLGIAVGYGIFLILRKQDEEKI